MFRIYEMSNSYTLHALCMSLYMSKPVYSIILLSPFRIPIHIPFPRLQITKCHVIMCNGLTLQCLGCAPSQNECVTLIVLQPAKQCI